MICQNICELMENRIIVHEENGEEKGKKKDCDDAGGVSCGSTNSNEVSQI